MPTDIWGHTFRRRCSLSFLIAVGYLPAVIGVRSEQEVDQRLATSFEICLNANQASLTQLKTIKGVGKALAADIVKKQPNWSERELAQKLKGSKILTARLNNSEDVIVCGSDRSGSADESADVKPTQRSLADPCLDVNEATESELERLPMWKGKESKFFIQVQKEAKCFTDLDHLEKAFWEAHNGKAFWDRHMAFYVEVGMFCVSNKELSKHCDPEPIRESGSPPGTNILHEKRSLVDCVQEMPQTRDVLDLQRTFNHATLRFATYTRGLGWHIHNGNIFATEMCKTFFPHVKHKPAAAPRAIADNTSVGVCAFVNSGENETSVPFMYSEYNIARGIPNFVAFQVRDALASNKIGTKVCRGTWKHVCAVKVGESGEETNARCHELVDRGYEPQNMVHDFCGLGDVTCKQRAGTRGHMNPASYNAWDDGACKATMTYLNAFPSRSGFDGGPWAAREQAVLAYLKKTRAKGTNGFLWMTVGVSTESDGEIKSLRFFVDTTTKSNVDVPKYVWSAFFDPRTKTATGWMCRNGLLQIDACHCIDKLSVHQLQRHLGFKIFPHLEGMEGVNLSDGSNKVFWDIVER